MPCIPLVNEELSGRKKWWALEFSYTRLMDGRCLDFILHNCNMKFLQTFRLNLVSPLRTLPSKKCTIIVKQAIRLNFNSSYHLTCWHSVLIFCYTYCPLENLYHDVWVYRESYHWIKQPHTLSCACGAWGFHGNCSFCGRGPGIFSHLSDIRIERVVQRVWLCMGALGAEQRKELRYQVT